MTFALIVLGLGRGMCFCFSGTADLPTDEVGVAQQVLCDIEKLDNSWRAFVASAVSFKTLIPVRMDEGRFADDLPKIPPDVISFSSPDASEKDRWTVILLQPLI